MQFAMKESGSLTVEHTHSLTCRFCNARLTYTFVNLGMSPLCESYVSREQLNQMEPFYPLHVFVCDRCFLVQLGEYVTPDHIFSEYAYFSSYADSWVSHARDYVEMIIKRLGLTRDSFVVELASNDGYLLQHFLPHHIPVLGIEPAANVAKTAVEKGIPTQVEFFGRAAAEKMRRGGSAADLIIGNNVLAQVPDLNDFVAGIALLLNTTGVATLEFPHLLRLMAENQFDTIYHEHFSYFSLITVDKIADHHGLRVFDVEELTTHGGSLRVYLCNKNDRAKTTGPCVRKVLDDEVKAGLTNISAYSSFAEKVKETKRALLAFLIEARRAGNSIAGYGAPGKGNTLLNYCGIGTDFIDFTVDRNPYKQGKFLPGTHIPIHHPDELKERKPDYVLILPWNFKEEIMAQNSYIRSWGAKFVIPIPSVRVL